MTMNEVINFRDVPNHLKGWGMEYWIYNNADYCGKELVLYKDKKCSVHLHKIKKETFYVISGDMIVDLYDRPFEILANNLEVTVTQLEAEGKLRTKSLFMTSGDSLTIDPMTPHRFRGLADETRFIEFSTTHFEEDSIRIFPGDSQTNG